MRPFMSEGVIGCTRVGVSGQSGVAPTLRRLPQMPSRSSSVSMKHWPRHWTLGPVAASMRGLQGSPSARSVSGAAVPHSPVLVLHGLPEGQWSLP